MYVFLCVCFCFVLFCFLFLFLFLFFFCYLVMCICDRPIFFLLFCLISCTYDIFAPNCVLDVFEGLITSEISALNCVFDWVHISHFFRLFFFLFLVQLGCMFYPCVLFNVHTGLLMHFCMSLNHFVLILSRAVV